jgi:hypothetical protein
MSMNVGRRRCAGLARYLGAALGGAQSEREASMRRNSLMPRDRSRLRG